MNFKAILSIFADIGDEDYALAEPLFEKKTYLKGEVMGVKHRPDSDLAFITKGLFRVYYTHPNSGKEISLFFFKEYDFMFSFLLFNSDQANSYFVEVLEDAEVLQINHENLMALYNKSHKWEHFGRVLAEQYYRGSNTRAETFIFNSPEERYLNLIDTFPDIFQRTSLINISSYLGIESQSLSRIRKRLVQKNK
jgi:CRP-like cAMP-binding protein